MPTYIESLCRLKLKNEDSTDDSLSDHCPNSREVSAASTSDMVPRFPTCFFRQSPRLIAM